MIGTMLKRTPGVFRGSCGDGMSEGISKLEAAQRQLDCAIRLFFENEDSLAVHTLAHAALRVLLDLYRHRGRDDFHQQLDSLVEERLGWRGFNRVPNFLKHADQDPEELLRWHSPEDTFCTLGFAAILYRRMLGRFTPEMRAFDNWITVLHHDEFDLPADPDPDIEAAFRESIELLSNASWEERLKLGRTLIEAYRINPNIGGMGAPEGL